MAPPDRARCPDPFNDGQPVSFYTTDQARALT
jgi:hypothetical protein